MDVVGDGEMVREDFERNIARVYLAICMPPSLRVWRLVRQFLDIEDAGGVGTRLEIVAGEQKTQPPEMA